jgi:type VI secretion system protein ImpG
MLRAMLRLYGPPQDHLWLKQVEGIVALRTQPVVRRLRHPGPLVFGRGIQVQLEVDELAFQGASAYALTSVLEHYFARQAAVNTFTETTLVSTSRGLVGRWPARVGAVGDLGV